MVAAPAPMERTGEAETQVSLGSSAGRTQASSALSVAQSGGQKTEPESAIGDIDRDSLHILPLCIVPLETPALRRARMIKDIRLNSVVELFGDKQTGSGQMDVEDVRRELGWPANEEHPDLTLLRRLALLPTYDVYSLRILLRDEGIPVNDKDHLRLSKSKQHELADYMKQFTHPLLSEVYGETDSEITTLDDVLGLFRDPDVGRARRNLKAMAEKLGITLPEIPRFLEDYADIFLSLSYYKRCLDEVVPITSQVLASFDDIRGNFQLKNDRSLMNTCNMIETTTNDLVAAITGRFESFDRSSGDMWRNLSAERFERVRTLITGYHTTIGGVLCALTVKLNAWSRNFPTADNGGPAKRAEFIMSELKQGMDKIQAIEDSAPTLASLG